MKIQTLKQPFKISIHMFFGPAFPPQPLVKCCMVYFTYIFIIHAKDIRSYSDIFCVLVSELITI